MIDLKEDKKEEETRILYPIYENVKSYYNKAYTKIISYCKYNHAFIDSIILYSYNTEILKIYINRENHKKSYYILNSYFFYSQTTSRHIKETIKQYLYNTDIYKILKKNNFTKNSIIKYSGYNKEI